jgi:RNA polymerase sigma factor (TIGR02999 family)
VSQLAQVLQNIEQGEPCSAEELLPLVYAELRRIASAKLARETPGQTLQPTALVHEAWLRLGGTEGHWRGRAHFIGAAAEAMRRILVDRARRRKAEKHGGALERVDLPTAELPIESDPDQLLRIHEALDELAAEEPLRAEVVKLHCFIGMDLKEIAAALDLSEKTIQRYWTYGKAWLRHALEHKF